MKNTGIFVGESLDGNACFSPDRAVSRGEFLAMLVRTLDIPTETASWTAEAPQWLQPYLAAAVRSGFITELKDGALDAPITVSEAQALVRGALDLEVETLAVEDGQQNLTRGDAAILLYETSLLARQAPGLRAMRR